MAINSQSVKAEIINTSILPQVSKNLIKPETPDLFNHLRYKLGIKK